jgi:CAAX protease family protein
MSDEGYPVDSPAAAESVPQRSGPRSLLKRVFVGPHGLRAGWKVLVFVLILFAVSFCLRPLRKLSGPVNRELPVPPGTALLYELSPAFAVLIATGIMARFIDRKPWG